MHNIIFSNLELNMILLSEFLFYFFTSSSIYILNKIIHDVEKVSRREIFLFEMLAPGCLID